eukprot:scaffold90928_cov36-Cyclotella_meneghiniana.AAC.2
MIEREVPVVEDQDQNPGCDADITAGQIGDNVADEDTAVQAVALTAEDFEVTFINNLGHPMFKAALLESRQHCCNPHIVQVGCTVQAFWYVDNNFYPATVVKNNITALLVDFDFHQDNERLLDNYLVNVIWYIKQTPSPQYPNPSYQDELTCLMDALQIFSANKAQLDVSKLVKNTTFLFYDAFYGNWRRDIVLEVNGNNRFTVLDGLGPVKHRYWCSQFLCPSSTMLVSILHLWKSGPALQMFLDISLLVVHSQHACNQYGFLNWTTLFVKHISHTFLAIPRRSSRPKLGGCMHCFIKPEAICSITSLDLGPSSVHQVGFH